VARARRRKAGFELAPADDWESYSGWRQRAESVQYVQPVSQIAHLARRYGLDVLIVLLTVAAIVELVVSHGSPKAATTPLWFAIPAIAIMMLPVFARRRFPFAAPAAYWLLAAALSFVDGRLVSSMTSIFLVGMAASFLLGNQRDALQARMGLAIVLGGAAIVVYNMPDHTASELVFIPLLFGICWLAGFALRGQAEQAEAAEVAAIRTVAGGDALLSPTITKRVIKQFSRIPRPDPPKEFDELTAREQEILRLVARGLSNAEIGRELYISETTVKTHVTHILQKLNLRDRVQAVVLAYQTGVFEPHTR
jgi:DNA-binding CsgD family transcriptional regulator